ARGIVHRDFKPANAMICDDGVVKLVDFGLSREDPGARVSASRGETSPLSRRRSLLEGTFGFMSPEQVSAHAPIDPRSDQFSFCVSLFVALFGRRPFDTPEPPSSRAPSMHAGASPATSTARVADSEALTRPSPAVPSPAALMGPYRPPTTRERRLVPTRILRALDRGLSLEPADRFPDMTALLAVLAPRTRLRKAAPWVLLGAVIATYGANAWIDARRCDDASTTSLDVWRSLRPAVERSLAERSGDASAGYVLDSMERSFHDWGDERQAVCEARHEDPPEIVRDRVACLSRARAALTATAEQLATSRGDGAAISEAPERLASLPALADCSRSAVIARQCQAVPDEPVELAAVTVIRRRLDEARARWIAGDYEQAVQEASATVDAIDPSARPGLAAEALFVLGDLQFSGGEPAAALETLLLARDAAERSRCAELHVDIYSRMTKIAALHEGLVPVAVAEERAHLELLRADSLTDDLERQALARSDRGLVLLHALRRADEAIVAFRSALERTPSDDRSAATRSRRANYLLNLGVALAHHGDHEEALQTAEEALATRIEAVGADHPIAYKEHRNVGNRLLASTAPDARTRARAHYERALALATAGFGDDSVAVADVHMALARLDSLEQRPKDALAHARAAAAIHDAREGEDRSRHVDALAAVAQTLIESGEEDKSLEPLHRARELAASAPLVPAGSRAIIDRTLAAVYNEKGEPERGLEHARAAVATLKRAGITDTDLAFPSLFLAEAILQRAATESSSLTSARVDEAAAALVEAIAAWEHSDDNPSMLAYAQWARAQIECTGRGNYTLGRSLAATARGYFTSVPADEESQEMANRIDRWLGDGCVDKAH
ncbi:MAG: tetratricopeptide repeat protein, partial [Myxococcales bacterium]|nr:tetratricopeptide repeat protein [Myxococcales bacterium]